MTISTHVRRGRRLAAAAGLALVAAVGPGMASAWAEPAQGCPAVEVVFARGTFEAPGVGATGQAFIDALNSRLKTPAAVYGVNYPASLDFQAAVGGVGDAANYIEALANRCPDTQIVLGGYSQGAAVAAYTTFDSVPPGYVLPPSIKGPMPESVASHVAAVALFGTPDSNFLDIVDRNAPPISVGPRYADKTVQLCAPGDPVCQPGGFERAAHSAYKSNGMADQAADFVVDHLSGGVVANGQ